MTFVPDDIFSLILPYVSNKQTFALVCKDFNRLFKKYVQPTKEQVKLAFEKGVSQAACEYLFEHEKEKIDRFALDMSAKHGYYRLVDKLLFEYPPTNETIENAIVGGHEKIVELLLSDMRVEPKQEWMDIAIKHGHAQVVDCLIVDGRFKIHDKYFNDAVSYGHASIVRLFIKDGYAYPTTRHVYSTIEKGNVDVLKELIDYVNPYDNEVYIRAIEHNKIEIIKYLLSCSHIYLDNKILVEAVNYNNIDIVKLLLEDGRIDPSAHNSRALRAAYNNYEIAKLLLSYEKVDPSAKNNQLAYKAVFHLNYDVAELVISDPRTRFYNLSIIKKTLCNKYHMRLRRKMKK